MVETNLTNQPGQPYDGPSVRQTCRNLIFNSTLVSTLKPTVYDGKWVTTGWLVYGILISKEV